MGLSAGEKPTVLISSMLQTAHLYSPFLLAGVVITSKFCLHFLTCMQCSSSVQCDHFATEISQGPNQPLKWMQNQRVSDPEPTDWLLILKTKLK